jgi:hypothetical protein
VNSQPSTSFRVSNELQDRFYELGYTMLNKQYPDFGGTIMFLQGETGELKATYCISKASVIELITSDELRRVLDFLEGSGTPLRYAITSSQFSHASHKLAREFGIELWELQPSSVDVARSALERLPARESNRPVTI